MKKFALALLVVTAAAVQPFAQAPAKRPLTVDDYTKWKSIGDTAISSDGKWVTYVLRTTNVPEDKSTPILHVLNLETNTDVGVPNGTGGVFSPDAKWLAYQVDPAPGRRGRGGRGGSVQPTEPSTQPPQPPSDPSVPPAAPAPGQPAPPAVMPSTPAPAQPPATPGVNPTPANPNPANPTPANPTPGQNPSAGTAATTASEAPPRRVEVRNLTTGHTESFQDIGSFIFSPDSTLVVMKRRPAEAAGTGGRGGNPGNAPGGNSAGGNTNQATAAEPSGRGTDVIVLDLRSGRHQLLGGVGDVAFTKKGDLLAYTVDLPIKDGNGIFVFDAKRGSSTPLDTEPRVYTRLAWSDDGKSLAVLAGNDVDKKRERDNVLLTWPDVRAAISDDEPARAIALDRTRAPNFPKDWVISDRAPLTWSDDDQRVFFGTKEQVAVPPPGERKSTDEKADVDVWNTSDDRIQSVQMIRADQDRNFTYKEAFDTSAAKFVKLADETMKDLDVAQDGRWAVGRDARAYESDYKPAAADIYRVDTTTGERTLMLKGQLTNTSTGSHVFGISPDGKHYLYWKDGRFQDYDFDAGSSRALGATGAPNFVDSDFDHPGPKPAFGVTGYTADGKYAIVEHKFDLWLLPLDGSAAKNMTNGTGTAQEMRLRYIRTEPADPVLTISSQSGGPGGPGGGFGGGRGGATREKPIDLAKPVLLSAYGEWTKKAGYYELSNGNLKPLVYEDASFNTPEKAANADKYLFTRQTFVEFPDLRVAGPTFTDWKKITDANPQQKDFMWGHRILFDFKDHDGHRLQAIMAIPDDYKQGEKRPTLVNFYEKNSQNLHRYNAPSYLTGMGSSPMQAVSDGYITLIPDVYFHTGSSHSDMLEAVEAAVRKAIEMGYVDPKHVGINGHSYGGEGAAFIGTRSRLFAAVGMGAGVTDLYQDFNQNWGWAYQVTGGSGANGDDYYLYGQGRWGFSPWDKPDTYMFESALTHVPEVTAPFLIMHGTSDPTVAFQNGLGFYNALRYNKKNAVLLAYIGEGHGLRGWANRKDLTVRYFQFFDHYLKGAPAPKWMTDGVPYLKKDVVDSER